MTEPLVKLLIDLSKPEGQRETIVPLTAEEIAQRELDAQQAAEQLAQREAEELAKAEAKQSAITKLEALGLSPEEISAITGA